MYSSVYCAQLGSDYEPASFQACVDPFRDDLFCCPGGIIIHHTDASMTHFSVRKPDKIGLAGLMIELVGLDYESSFRSDGRSKEGEVPYFRFEI